MKGEKSRGTAMQYGIHIERLAIHSRHGVLPQERTIGAVFYVSMEAQVKVVPEAYESDCLDGTVSYADIVGTIREEMSVPSNLLEHLVYRVARRLLDDYSSIISVRLRIDKENPPCGVCADSIGVSLLLSK